MGLQDRFALGQILDPCRICTRSTWEKLENIIDGLFQKLVTPPPIFNQFTSEIFHSVLQEIVYDIMGVFDFVCYIGFYKSQQRVGTFIFSK